MAVRKTAAVGPPQPNEVLHDLGFFGHYLHIHAGGRGGKQFVLCALDKHDGHLTQRQLAEMSNTSSAALSEVLSKLAGENLITREACEEDRRQLNIRLTELGAHKARTISDERAQFEAEAFSCLSEGEYQTLASLLASMKQHWKSLEKKEVSA